MTSNPNIGQEQADALAKALCLLDSFAGDGLGHVYGNGTTIDADDACSELCAAFGIELEAGWWRALAEQLATTPTPAQVEPVDNALLDRAELAWQRFFYPNAECFTGSIGDKLPSVDLEVADCLRLMLAAVGRLVVTPERDVPPPAAGDSEAGRLREAASWRLPCGAPRRTQRLSAAPRTKPSSFWSGSTSNRATMGCSITTLLMTNGTPAPPSPDRRAGDERCHGRAAEAL